MFVQSLNEWFDVLFEHDFHCSRSVSVGVYKSIKVSFGRGEHPIDGTLFIGPTVVIVKKLDEIVFD